MMLLEKVPVVKLLWFNCCSIMTECFVIHSISYQCNGGRQYNLQLSPPYLEVSPYQRIGNYSKQIFSVRLTEVDKRK